MKVKALVFDFGNVVGFFSHRRAAERLAAHARLGADEVHCFLFGGQLEDDYESGRLTTADFLRRLREGCGLSCPDDVLADAYADIFWPNPEVCALLPSLAERCRLLLLSNTNDLHARKFLGQFEELLRPFAHRILSHEVGVRKPRPGIFAHAQQLADCAPEEIVFIDDLPANVVAAVACGWHGIVYTDLDSLRRDLAALNIIPAAA
ncbi:MAG: HAD family phosphatase [Planctomycetes bacterium]|nr:HAD family phosphatase [Planctomycetota bacterium]